MAYVTSRSKIEISGVVWDVYQKTKIAQTMILSVLVLSSAIVMSVAEEVQIYDGGSPILAGMLAVLWMDFFTVVVQLGLLIREKRSHRGSAQMDEDFERLHTAAR